MKNKFKCGMRANCKTIDDACCIDFNCIDLKKILEEFYKKASRDYQEIGRKRKK